MSHLPYRTNCTQSTAEIINFISDNATDITFRTFCRHTDWKPLANDMGYCRGGLVLRDDWHVSYHKVNPGIIGGHRVYFMCHSAIEYIFADDLGWRALLLAVRNNGSERDSEEDSGIG